MTFASFLLLPFFLESSSPVGGFLLSSSSPSSLPLFLLGLALTSAFALGLPLALALALALAFAFGSAWFSASSSAWPGFWSAASSFPGNSGLPVKSVSEAVLFAFGPAHGERAHKARGGAGPVHLAGGSQLEKEQSSADGRRGQSRFTSRQPQNSNHVEQNRKCTAQ